MPLVLTCDCGARFEVDDHLAGQDVRCPECRQPLAAAGRAEGPPRLSWLALFSLALALAGAFTVVGSAAAAVLGVAALAVIRRHPDRLGGRGFALAGLGLGLAFTALSLLALPWSGRLPVGAWLRRRALAGRVDPSAPKEVSSRDGACLLTRPSDDWEVLRAQGSGDPAVSDLQKKRDVVLCNARLHAYADLAREATSIPPFAYDQDLLASLQPRRPPLIGEEEPNAPPALAALPRVVEGWPRRLEPIDSHDGREWLIDVPLGGQTWRFLIRAYRRPRGKGGPASPLYVLRAYAPRRLFAAAEGELRRLLDSARFSP
jgi:hypothetical protein